MIKRIYVLYLSSNTTAPKHIEGYFTTRVEAEEIRERLFNRLERQLTHNGAKFKTRKDEYSYLIYDDVSYYEWFIVEYKMTMI
jgi:hypothetical protein